MVNAYLTEGGNDGTVSGSISYDPATKTLTLDGVTASLSCDFHIVDVRNSDYTIVVKGSNKLTTISEALSIWGSNTTITGGGTLTLESTGGSQGLFFYPSGVNPPYTLTFDQVTVHNLSGDLGGYSNEKLVINNATLTNKGNIY